MTHPTLTPDELALPLALRRPIRAVRDRIAAETAAAGAVRPGALPEPMPHPDVHVAAGALGDALGEDRGPVAVADALRALALAVLRTLDGSDRLAGRRMAR